MRGGEEVGAQLDAGDAGGEAEGAAGVPVQAVRAVEPRSLRQSEAVALMGEGGLLEGAVVDGLDPQTGETVQVALDEALIARDCDACFADRVAQCALSPLPPLDSACCHCFYPILGDPCDWTMPPPQAIQGCDAYVYRLIDDTLYGPYCAHYA